MYTTTNNKKYEFNIGMALTKEQFLIKVQNLHGDEELELDKIEYKNLNEDINLKCKKHGEFKIRAGMCINKKARKYICEECNMEYRISKLINKKTINKNHEYQQIMDNNRIKGLCKIYNSEFSCSKESIYTEHGGCKLCKRDRDREIFLNKIKSDTRYANYDYSGITYVDKYTPIRIRCVLHEIEFTQKPIIHLSKYGICPECVNDKKLKKFIKESKEIHLDKYDYSLIKRYHTGDKLPIVCKEHGIFEQKPIDHLKCMIPCPKCGDRLGRDLEEYIKKCNELYKNKYDYSLVKYKNSKTSIKIICPIHGIFNKLPYNHLENKQGCPKCIETNISSKSEIKWLNSLRVPIRSYEIENYIVDGYDDISNTIYEFLGDYWHGNLDIFKSEVTNEKLNITFKELNEKTFKRLKHLKDKGYRVIYIWESDWVKGKSPSEI